MRRLDNRNWFMPCDGKYSQNNNVALNPCIITYPSINNPSLFNSLKFLHNRRILIHSNFKKSIVAISILVLVGIKLSHLVWEKNAGMECIV